MNTSERPWAPTAPPVSGASTKWCPLLRAPPRSRWLLAGQGGGQVEQDRPGAAAVSPLVGSRGDDSGGGQRGERDLAGGRHLGDRADRSRAVDRRGASRVERRITVTSCPSATRFAAIAPPMLPSPTTPSCRHGPIMHDEHDMCVRSRPAGQIRCPPMQIDGKNVLLTGASSGIGAALAPLLASRGATVGIVARREDRLARGARAVPGPLTRLAHVRDRPRRHRCRRSARAPGMGRHGWSRRAHQQRGHAEAPARAGDHARGGAADDAHQLRLPDPHDPRGAAQDARARQRRDRQRRQLRRAGPASGARRRTARRSSP